MKERYDTLQNIFDLLLLNNSAIEIPCAKPLADREPHISKKIEINFGKNQRDNITTTFQNLLPDIDLVCKFFEHQFKIDAQPANRLIERIRQIFIKIMNSRVDDTSKVSYTEIPINDFAVMQEIADELLKPHNYSFSNDEVVAAQSVVLCVFENCDIGLPPKKNNKFKNPKRFIQLKLFDNLDTNKSNGKK